MKLLFARYIFVVLKYCPSVIYDAYFILKIQIGSKNYQLPQDYGKDKLPGFKAPMNLLSGHFFAPVPFRRVTAKAGSYARTIGAGFLCSAYSCNDRRGPQY